MLYLKAVTNLELILGMLAEATTTQFHTVRVSVFFPELKCDENDGGGVAENARMKIEQKSGRAVVSGENHLDLQKGEGQKANRSKRGLMRLKSQIRPAYRQAGSHSYMFLTSNLMRAMNPCGANGAS